MVKKKQIFSIDDISDGDINRLFFRARSFKESNNYPQFRKAVLLTAFFEPSTRTRLSFEMAALRLGMRVANFQPQTSSMSKGESIEETIDTLLAMNPDILVTRQAESLKLPLKTHGIVINGGDGCNEHPSQALLDCFTLLHHFQSDNLYKKNILIIGDIAHSRVAHSGIKLLKRLNANVFLLSPKALAVVHEDVENFTSFNDVPTDIDVVMCLRVQKERLGQGDVFNQRDFIADFCLTKERLENFHKHCAILHPGPMNKGIEISEEVAKHPCSLISEQVKNGIFIRAALMEYGLELKSL